MKYQSLNSEEAAYIFLDRIKHNAYDSVIHSMQILLEQGPPGRKKNHKQVELYRWFQDLDEYNRKLVLDVVEESIKLSIFSFLVILDNKISGSLLENQIADIDVRLSTYDSDNSKFSYSPQLSARINLSYNIDGDLHEKFEKYLKQ